MTIKKSDKKSTVERNRKAASILRTIDGKDLTKVAGGICRGCGLGVSEPDPTPVLKV